MCLLKPSILTVSIQRSSLDTGQWWSGSQSTNFSPHWWGKNWQWPKVAWKKWCDQIPPNIFQPFWSQPPTFWYFFWNFFFFPLIKIAKTAIFLEMKDGNCFCFPFAKIANFLVLFSPRLPKFSIANFLSIFSSTPPPQGICSLKGWKQHQGFELCDHRKKMKQPTV